MGGDKKKSLGDEAIFERFSLEGKSSNKMTTPLEVTDRLTFKVTYRITLKVTKKEVTDRFTLR